jgi:hypothetical protein
MLGSVVLDVAIGMAFVYLLLSLIASVTQEMLAALVQARAANLQRGLRSLLSGDSIEAGASLVDSIYNHGLIRGLYQDPAKDYPLKYAAETAGGKLSGWSRFRLTLQRRVGIAPPLPIAGISNPLLLPAYIPARTFALTMIDLLNRDKLNGKPPVENIRDFLTGHYKDFPNNKAVEALLTLVVDAEGSGEKLQTNLENWFNDGMDRVSGWYKKYTQKILLILGLLLAVAFNVNSVRIGRTLWFNRDARQGMVDAASDYLKNHPAPAADSQAASGDKQAAIDEKQAPIGEKQPANGDIKANMRLTVSAFEDVTRESLLPVGWRHKPAEYGQWAKAEPRWSQTVILLETLVGWLITAAAISLGAPFWFDLLNKFMVVRSTIKPSEKSSIQKSKDK